MKHRDLIAAMLMAASMPAFQGRRRMEPYRRGPSPKTLRWLRSFNGKAHQNSGEIARRRAQIERGQLTAANGLVRRG